MIPGYRRGFPVEPAYKRPNEYNEQRNPKHIAKQVHNYPQAISISKHKLFSFTCIRQNIIRRYSTFYMLLSNPMCSLFSSGVQRGGSPFGGLQGSPLRALSLPAAAGGVRKLHMALAT